MKYPKGKVKMEAWSHPESGPTLILHPAKGDANRQEAIGYLSSGEPDWDASLLKMEVIHASKKWVRELPEYEP